MKRFFVIIFVAFSLFSNAAFSKQNTAALTKPPSACHYLEKQVDAIAPSDSVFIPSFPSESDGPLHNTAFLYDNAVATVALIGCKKTQQAKRIGDAILYAIAHDRYWHDGRLRNAYAAGVVGEGLIKMPGWWDKSKNQWVEDRYQVGSDNGNLAWAMLALLALDKVNAGKEYANGALKIASWIAPWRDPRGAGGFMGGTFAHEPAPEVNSWKSTEHNIDLASAFRLLADATQDNKWRELANYAAKFVFAMWDKNYNAFITGVGSDGVSANSIIALDAQIWPLLAFPTAVKQYHAIFETVDQRIAVKGGLAYSEAKEGVWTEGTAQMIVLDQLAGRPQRAKQRLRDIAPLQLPDGGYYASNSANLPTSFMSATDPTKPRFYLHIPHLAAAAWMALAESNFNPFTATYALPQ